MLLASGPLVSQEMGELGKMPRFKCFSFICDLSIYVN